MLQALHTHLKPTSEAIASIEYRNMAPLYCDEAMRICVKRKRQTDTGHSWDIWIEGPTGGMAVKGVAHSSSTQALNVAPESSQPATKTPVQELIPVSRQWRGQRIGSALSYLYLQPGSPLLNTALVDREAAQGVAQKVTPPPAPLPAQNPEDQSSPPDPSFVPLVPFSKKWRKRWIGDALPWLYAHSFTPLVNRNVVPRAPPPTPHPASSLVHKPNSSPASASASPPKPTPTSPDSHPPFRLFKIYDCDSGVISTRTARGIQTKEFLAARRRKKEGLAKLARGEPTPAEKEAVFGFLDTGDMAREREIVRLAAQRKSVQRDSGEQEEEEEVRVKKVEGFRVRGVMGVQRDEGGYRRGERREAWERKVEEGRRKREEREGSGGE